MVEVFGMGAKSKTGFLILKFKMASKMAAKMCEFFLIICVKGVKLHSNAFVLFYLIVVQLERIIRI